MRKLFCLITAALLPMHVCANDDVANALKYGMPAATVAIAYSKGDKEGIRQFAWAFGGSVATTYALKAVVDKERPNGSDSDSFPSGHVTSAFVSAAFLDRRYGHRYGLPAYALASWVAYSRVENDHHHVEDVLAGAAIGVLANRWLTTKYDANTMQITLAPIENGGLISIAAPW